MQFNYVDNTGLFASQYRARDVLQYLPHCRSAGGVCTCPMRLPSAAVALPASDLDSFSTGSTVLESYGTLESAR